jgi:hypothetical protein
MEKIIFLFCLSCVWTLPASAETNLVFQIGVRDGDYREFAIAGHWEDYSTKFRDDVNFTVGQSDPAQDWPYILPGPVDAWAGNKIHTFTIHFQIPQPAARYYQLVADFVSAQGAFLPELVIDVNGGQVERKLPKGGGDEAMTDPRNGQACSIQQIIPATQFHPGDNTITLSSDSGSWALFDDVRLESGIPAPSEPTSLQATPLPFFKRTPEGLQRAIKVTINNLEWKTGPVELDWNAKGLSGSQQIDLNFGENDSIITVPDTDEVDLTLKTATDQIQLPVPLPPAKKWLLYIVPTTHTDIGYTDLQDRIKVRHANNGLAAMRLLDEYPDFKWYSETFWQFNVMLLLHPEVADQAFELMRENRWELSADYANMLTGLCSSEALDRLTLDSRKMANRGGFELNSDILDDVPSAVGSLPMVLAHSGIKYFIEGANNDRAPYAGRVPNPFYWEGADGSRVLADITGGYGMAANLLPNMKQATEQLSRFLDRFQANSRYPYDAVLINGAYSDNGPVENWLPKVVNEWNSEWAYPKMIFAQPEDYYGYIVKNFSSSIPVLKTDFGDWWADGAGSAAYETALSRRAEERAVTAEILHSLTGIMTGADYPLTNFDDVWQNILLYNEHTWGAGGSIDSPHSEQTVKQWAVKASYAHLSDAGSRELLNSGMSELAGMVPAADLVVFNPLAWPRSAVVKTDEGGAVQDVASGKVYECQSLPEGGSCFVADDLPSIGYRTYRSATAQAMPQDAVQISGNEIENEFYRVTLNPQTGGIQSIYDKQLGREFVDANSQYNLGELIYVTGGKGTYAINSNLHLPPPRFEYHPQTGVQIESTNGPVFGELDSEATAMNFPKITMRVRLYKDLKQLDLIFELDKTETFNKEAVYLAFPLEPDARQGGLWLDYPDEITEPLKDQHASACRDWYAVQRWLAVSDGNDTVELSSLDAPLFTLGQMTASTWPTELPLDRGHVFGYIMNNYWHTNYKASQGGHFVFRYSLTSSAGGFSAHDAVVDGWNMYCPAVAANGGDNQKPLFSDAAGSLVVVRPLGLPLTTIKEAEDGSGFIFRVCDYSGEGGKLELELPRRATKAVKCDLVETEMGKLSAHGKRVTAPIKPFAPVTVKVEFRRYESTDMPLL